MIRTLVRAAAHPAFETKVGHPLGKLCRRKRGDIALQDSRTTLTHHRPAHLRIVLDVLHDPRLEHVRIGTVPIAVVLSHKLRVVTTIVALPLPAPFSISSVVRSLLSVFLWPTLIVSSLARQIVATLAVGTEIPSVPIETISWQIQLASRASLGQNFAQPCNPSLFSPKRGDCAELAVMQSARQAD